VVQKGGVDAILRGMKLHEGTSVVPGEACEALWTLAESRGTWGRDAEYSYFTK
jgi:hypothetical protein